MEKFEKHIVDIIKSNLLAYHATDRNKIKQSVINTLKDLTENDKSINSFKVELIEEPPEIQLIREVMEELCDQVHLNITIQPPPLTYICHTFNIEPEANSNSLTDKTIKEPEDQ